VHPCATGSSDRPTPDVRGANGWTVACSFSFIVFLLLVIWVATIVNNN
jgi:hypothetical protein